MILSLNSDPTDLDFYIVRDDDQIPGKPRALTADTLSILTDIFEK